MTTMIKHLLRWMVWVKAFEGVSSVLDLIDLTADQRKTLVDALDVLRRIKP